MKVKSLKACVSAFGLLASFVSPLAQAAPGDLASDFNVDWFDGIGYGSKTVVGDGSVVSSSSTNLGARAIATQSDGQIVVVGLAQHPDTSQNQIGILVSHENADGSGFGLWPDPYGPNNFTVVGSQPAANAIAIQSDNKILVAGSSDGNFLILRFYANGGLDTTFSGDGKAFVDFSNFDTANTIVIQSDGKIVVAGTSYQNINGRGDGDFSVARLNANGTLDTSFSGDGKVETSFDLSSSLAANASINSVALQSDGKILTAGTSADNYINNSTGNFALARYTSAGVLDSAFGSNGKIVTDLGNDDTCNGVIIQPDNKIVAAGTTATTSTAKFAIVRYSQNGVIDTGFGTSGVASTTFISPAYAYGIARQSDGKLVLAGKSGQGSTLARYSTSGVLDTSFTSTRAAQPNTGKIAYQILYTLNEARALKILSNGKILVAGNCYEPISGGYNQYHQISCYVGTSSAGASPPFPQFSAVTSAPSGASS